MDLDQRQSKQPDPGQDCPSSWHSEMPKPLPWVAASFRGALG
jgi:hypothetical protein